MNNLSKAVLLLGSNEGNRMDYLKNAIGKIEEEVGRIERSSQVYETVAWGYADQPDFLNQVITITTELNPADLLKAVLKIEKDLGRIRSQKWQQRTIDIDLLFYNDTIVDTPDLKIPHSMIAERRFTLIPLSELMPDYIHPAHKKSISQLLEECCDKNQVRKFQLIPG